VFSDSDYWRNPYLAGSCFQVAGIIWERCILYRIVAHHASESNEIGLFTGLHPKASGDRFDVTPNVYALPFSFRPK
jgi:hypothetical protein